MWTERAAEQVVSVTRVRYPIAQGFVDCVLQCLRSAFDYAPLRAEQTHPQNVRLLPADVFRSHVNDAIEAQQRTHRRGCDAMLTRAGLGDDAPLAHPRREQSLAQRVIDFVRAGVEEIFALQEKARAARVLREARSEAERSRSPGIIAPQLRQLPLKITIAGRGAVGYG